MSSSCDKDGNIVRPGDIIEVLEIDSRLYQGLDDEDRQALLNFIGDKLEVNKVNSDGSMLVTKMKTYGDIIAGHDVAIFPNGARLVLN